MCGREGWIHTSCVFSHYPGMCVCFPVVNCGEKVGGIGLGTRLYVSLLL